MLQATEMRRILITAFSSLILFLNRPEDAIQQNRETGGKPTLNLEQYEDVD